MVDKLLQLETLSDSGKPPKSRIANASDASQIGDSLIFAGQERSRWNARLKGMFDGNPPFSPAKLRAEAQAWRANVNFLEAKAASSAALVPYYDLFSGAKYYSRVQCEYYESPEQTEYCSNVITEEFDYLLKEYDGFDFNMQWMLGDFMRFGRGYLMWPDESDWRFHCTPQHKVFVSDGSDATPENLELLMVRQSYRVHELYKYIEDRETARTMGWDIDGVVASIVNAMPESYTEPSANYTYEWVQQRIKDRDLLEGVRCSTVGARHLLVKEFDGKVSHFIVDEPRGPQKANRDAARSPVPQNFLYKNIGRFDDFRQIISTFFLETPDGSWNGAQGLGHDLYSMMALKDRLKCATIDLSFMRTGVTLQAKTAAAMQKASLTRFGPVNIIPPDFEVQQAGILGDIQAPLSADRMLDEVIMNNTGVYRQRQEKPQGNPRTAREVELQYQTQAVLSNSGVNRFYLQLDKCFAETYRRVVLPRNNTDEDFASRKAREFIKRCTNRGVPDQAIRNVRCVLAYRNAGNGSIVMRQQNIQSTLPLFGLLPENGKQNFLDYALSSIHGQSMADLFNPKTKESKLPTEDASWAMLENSAIKTGAPVQWNPHQNDVIHAQIHLQAGAQAGASLEQGANPAEVAAFIDGIGQHTSIHLQHLQQSPMRKQEFQTLSAQWKALANVSDQLKKHLSNMAQQDAQQQQKTRQAMTDEQLATMQAQGEERRANAKTAQQLRTGAAKTKQKLALADAQTASDINRKNRMAMAEVKNNGVAE
jgi:hypothetical protein